jgi:hypothetical protein
MFFDQYIEDDARPIIFFGMLLEPKNSHVFGLDLGKLRFVVTKWSQDVTMSSGCSLVSERDDFPISCHCPTACV